MTKETTRMSIRQRLAVTAVTGLLGFGSVACTATSEAATPADGGADGATVSVEQVTFEPRSLTVPAGTTVTWDWNSGAIAHDVVGEDFASEVQATGVFRHRFDQPGTYTYVCRLHPNMTGTIEVTS